jgi:hypothetical protein
VGDANESEVVGAEIQVCEVYEVWADRWAEGWIKTKGFIKTKSLKGGVQV